MAYKIKTRKQRETDYCEKYDNISTDMYTRLKADLGDKFNIKLLNQVNERIHNVIKTMTYSSISFIFYEVPIQTHRPRANFKTKSFRTPNAADNHKAIENLIKNIKTDLTIIVTPMKIIMDAYYPMPKHLDPIEEVLYETKHQFCIDSPDFDNVLKAYCDMIQESIILDDNLVCSCEFNKFYSLKPRVELTIIYQDYFEAKYAYNKIRKRKKFKDQQDRISVKLISAVINNERRKNK